MKKIAKDMLIPKIKNLEMDFSKINTVTSDELDLYVKFKQIYKFEKEKKDYENKIKSYSKSIFTSFFIILFFVFVFVLTTTISILYFTN